MSLSIHIGYSPSENALRHLYTQLNDGIMVTHGTEIPENASYQILISGRPSVELLEGSPNLSALMIPFAGLPAVTRERMADYPDIAVHNVHYNAPPTAEMALALLMASARNLIPSDREFRQNNWIARYEPYPSILLGGKTALILGYGAVGASLGILLKAMGMTVIGTRRSNIDEAKGIYASDKLHVLLPQAQVLIVALPATDETEGLVGKEEFDLLPEGAIVVNIGRASVIDQYAFYDALKSGYLHGGASDVWYHYPKNEAERDNTAPADVPFHELDNMVLSPHRAGGGGNDEIEFMRMTAIAESVNIAHTGVTMPHEVNLDLGY